MNPITPISVYKENKSRIDLRKVTREFQKRFTVKSKTILEAGKVYAMKYIPDHKYQTDKYHYTPIILSLGIFNKNGRIFMKGINLLYINLGDVLSILEEAYLYESMKPIQRTLNIIKMNDKYIGKFEYAYKYFDLARISTYNEVEPEVWGFIPILKKELFGNFNIDSLQIDYKKENVIIKKRVNKTVNKKKDTKKEVPTESYTVPISEPLSVEQILE